ncbi:MAG: trypsin-like peptidase domain-containing protein [Bacteroidetes bacterium]|nr:trypsin-like peptidase domain-containing protein [Bacteroidota bacterium]
MKHPILKKILFSVFIPALSGMAGAWMFNKNRSDAGSIFRFGNAGNSPISQVNLKDMPAGFVKASKLSTPAVVFIKTVSTVQYRSSFWFWDFDPFGSRGQVSSSGSGVIVSADGYIVTNHHVIANAEQISVTLSNNKKEYTAKVVGKDPSTDLALLKIEAGNLPAITLGNSEVLEIGDWVLAVGNPFNLNSTVTAGIVSAKGRNINIVNNQFPIESFIQTDAAINPGNSGGALVNLNGELVGINTAIASQTGSYTGYGFAIPVNMVAKIIKDFVEFGEVQRGFPGLTTEDISNAILQKLSLNQAEGAYVSATIEEGPADKAGIKAGDIITKIDGTKVSNKAFYEEHLAYYRPGATVKFTVLRDGKEQEFSLTLMNAEGNTKLMRRNMINSRVLGADFQPVNQQEMQRYRISSGIKVSNIVNGSMASMGIQDGSIITKFNGRSYTRAEDLVADLEQARGRITIEGISPSGTTFSYSFFGY